MSPNSRGPVVIDTGVFGARLTPSGRLLASRYRPLLEARPAIISFITVAELEYGARLAGWGPDRLRRLEYEITRAEVVWPGPNLTEAYALRLILIAIIVAAVFPAGALPGAIIAAGVLVVASRYIAYAILRKGRRTSARG